MGRSVAELIPDAYRSPGLSDGELAAIQARTHTEFPPDLCDLLQQTLPKGSQFPPWRDDPEGAMQRWSRQVLDGILFDVVENDVWFAEWGDRPSRLDDLQAVVRANVSGAPKLIPIYGHRAIPTDPPEAGNPVFSVVQTDIIVYGGNLEEYLLNEFARQGPAAPLARSVSPRHIRFWSALADA